MGSRVPRNVLTGKVVGGQYLVGFEGGPFRWGSSYHAVDQRTSQQVWLRVFSSGVITALLKERIATISAQPRCARMIALFSEGQDSLLVSEQPPGYLLSDELRDARLSPVRALSIVEALAAATAELHGKGIAHGDILAQHVVVGTPAAATALAGPELRLIGPFLPGLCGSDPAAPPPAPADDVAQCGELLRAMLIDSHEDVCVLPAGLRELIGHATADSPAARPSAAALAQRCRDCAAHLSASERSAVRPLAPPPPFPPPPPPPNWSPPPPPPPFRYGVLPQASGMRGPILGTASPGQPEAAAHPYSLPRAALAVFALIFLIAAIVRGLLFR